MDIICVDHRVAWRSNGHQTHSLSIVRAVCAAPDKPAASRAIQSETNKHDDIANFDVLLRCRRTDGYKSKQ
jgi:hypothetical protein